MLMEQGALVPGFTGASIFGAVQHTAHMESFFFAIGKFCQDSFDFLLVPFGWIPVAIFCGVLAFGAVYWMNAQAKYTRRAKERKEYI